jgi:hypothetical protein
MLYFLDPLSMNFFMLYLYEIQDVYRLREKPVTPSNIFDVIGGRGGPVSHLW